MVVIVSRVYTYHQIYWVVYIKYGFSSSHVWMWELDYKESWGPKNWCFWTGCWKRVPWTARRSDQSILKEISSEYSSKGLMLKLKLQYFDRPVRRTDSLEKTLLLGKIKGRWRRGWQRMKWLDGIIYSMDMSMSKLWEMIKDREALRAVIHGVTKSQTWLSDWTTTTMNIGSGYGTFQFMNGETSAWFPHVAWGILNTILNRKNC